MIFKRKKMIIMFLFLFCLFYECAIFIVYLLKLKDDAEARKKRIGPLANAAGTSKID